MDGGNGLAEDRQLNLPAPGAGITGTLPEGRLRQSRRR